MVINLTSKNADKSVKDKQIRTFDTQLQNNEGKALHSANCYCYGPAYPPCK